MVLSARMRRRTTKSFFARRLTAMRAGCGLALEQSPDQEPAWVAAPSGKRHGICLCTLHFYEYKYSEPGRKNVPDN